MQRTVWGTGVALALSMLRPRPLRTSPVRWELPASFAAVRTARAYVRDYVDGLLDPQTGEDAELITSELVANAANASTEASAVELGVQLIGNHLLIEVFDRAEGAPQRCCASEFDEGGRGLLLVEELTRLWGWHPVPGGKVVWAVVPGDPDRSRSST